MTTVTVTRVTVTIVASEKVVMAILCRRFILSFAIQFKNVFLYLKILIYSSYSVNNNKTNNYHSFVHNTHLLYWLSTTGMCRISWYVIMLNRVAQPYMALNSSPLLPVPFSRGIKLSPGRNLNMIMLIPIIQNHFHNQNLRK